MKKMLLLVLASALTAAPALAAIDMNAEVFITHKATLQGVTDTAVKNEGTDVERFRIFLSNKFNDQWAFKGRFEFKAGAAPTIPEAHLVGTGVLMTNDWLKVGIQDNPVFTMENGMGNRWITKSVVDSEGFAVASIQSGFSYGMKFNALGVTLFTLSAESGDNLDTDDNNKLNGAMVDYKINDAMTVYVQSASTNMGAAGVAAAAAKSTTIMSAGLSYKSDMVNAGFNYHTASYTVETGVAPKNQMVMGVNGLFKKIAGTSTNLYAHYLTGYDKYADTLEDTQSKMMIGPTWAAADGKIDWGVFYEMETLQGEYKTAVAGSKDPSAAYLKFAAKF